VVEALLTDAPNAHDITFVGTADGFERPLIQQSGIQFHHYEEIQAGPINGVGLLKASVSTLKILFGITQATRIIQRYQPQAILLTGGWANVPLALAAYVLRVPMLVYLPDIEPAKTINFLARIVQKVTITVSDSAKYFPNVPTVVTGYPLRQNMLSATREKGLAHFKLDASRPIILVFGGSRGAQTINIATENILAQLLEAGYQVIHVTGTLDWERSQAITKPIANTDYHAFAYLHEDMGLAMACADVVVCRAGASALGELPHFALPSILVPYPYAWQYQKTNADYLATHGASIYLQDEKMATDLYSILRKLLTDRVQLNQMKEKAQALNIGDGAKAIAHELLQLVE
jgi:UDP-N-acetylglucosamine--N-acetylmuramyl-(pentapeptide) pyrophosphoryl-undecaprenol N-acetylglucosamine transferase